jgi:hypothetical protein
MLMFDGYECWLLFDGCVVCWLLAMLVMLFDGYVMLMMFDGYVV